jgi:hypothetical protein
MQRKGLNSAVARNVLAKSLYDCIEKVNKERWLTNTTEGQLYAAKIKQEAENTELKKQFAVGQMVWREDIAYPQDLNSGVDDGWLVNRCNRITEVHDSFVQTEMLFAIDADGFTRQDEYSIWSGYICKKGDEQIYMFYELEKHIAKSGNTWWRFKIK